MSKVEENPFLNPKTKKKHLWGLWIPLIIIASIIFVPAGLAMVLFFDTSHYDTGVKEAVEAQQLFGGLKNTLFDNCRNNEDPSIDITISEQNLNKLLYGVAAQINTNIPAGVSQYVKIEQMDIQITDQDYVLDLEASALNFFKTRAQIRMHVSTNATLPNGEKGFIFDIIDSRVGRLGGMVELANSFIDLGQMLKIDGINWTYSKENSCIYYANSDFQTDLINLAGFGSGLFTDLFNTFFEKDLLQFPHNKGYINGKISIKDFQKNSTFYSDTLTIREKETVGDQEELMLNVKADQINSLLNSNVLTEAKATQFGLALDKACLVIHKFLAFGIDFVTESNEVNLINSLNEDNTFKALLGNKSISEYSELRRNSYFGTSSTDFVEEIKNNAQTKITNLVEAAADADKNIDLGELDLEEITRRIINGEPLPESIDRDELKTSALFRGIQGKIVNSKDHAWYLYGGDRTTYYFDNTATNWKKVYAYGYNSETGEYEADDPGVRMTFIGDNIWSYDLTPGYDHIIFGNGVDTNINAPLNPEKRYLNNGEWAEVPDTIVETPNSVRINDSNIHDLVKDNSAILGFGIPFVGKNDNGQYNYSYTIVDNIYPVTTKVDEVTYFALVFGLNINGSETQLVLPCEQVPFEAPGENVFGLKFSIENATMYYGDVEVPGVKDTLSDLMAQSTISSSFFSIDDNATTMTFTIDLNDLVNNGKFKTMHDELTAPEETDAHPYACNAKLFVNIIPSINPLEEQAENGVGGFDIEVGYVSRES